MTSGVVFTVAAACVPAARPLVGAPTRAELPNTSLPPGNRQMSFTWKYKDDTFEAQGDGVVRVAAPNRARLDFFLKNGMGGGMAILDGDSLIIPGIDLVRRFLPPLPLLWATLGRLSVSATRDTIARQDGDTLRADLAGVETGRVWRVTFAGRVLARVERIDKGKIQEWVSRTINDQSGTGELRYTNEGGRRSLSISVTETRSVEAFDDAIWRRP
ncbi:MAG: hypothetical protein H7Z40_02650 [Phycisphaerae bacterium]|nr:hypothetical protein [Gemmatimonadaceae bacterium]